MGADEGHASEELVHVEHEEVGWAEGSYLGYLGYDQ